MTSNLLQAAQTRQEELVAFLQELVRLRSVNGRETEAAVAQRIADEARRLDLAAELVAADPNRPNVLVSWGTGPAGFALIGHMDTVAAGNPGSWTHPPFDAQIEDGRLYGRGAADNKAGIACGLYTAAVMRDLELLDPDKHRLIVAGVVDEESGASSQLGVRYLLDQGYLPVRGAIYTYTSDIICIGHRGLIRLKLQAKGKSLHSGSAAWSRGEGGVNAVTGLAAILVALEELTLPAPSHPAFADLGFTITPGTLFQGGEFVSIVPASAEDMVDIRLMPGQSAEAVLAAVQAVIDEELGRRPGLSVSADVEINLPGAAIPVDHPLVEAANRYTKLMTGREWAVAGAGPANEGYMLIEAGIPTLCGFGPSGDRAHAPDEWVELASLPITVAIYCGIIKDYLVAAG